MLPCLLFVLSPLSLPPRKVVHVTTRVLSLSDVRDSKDIASWLPLAACQMKMPSHLPILAAEVGHAADKRSVHTQPAGVIGGIRSGASQRQVKAMAAASILATGRHAALAPAAASRLQALLLGSSHKRIQRCNTFKAHSGTARFQILALQVGGSKVLVCSYAACNLVVHGLLSTRFTGLGRMRPEEMKTGSFNLTHRS